MDYKTINAVYLKGKAYSQRLIVFLNYDSVILQEILIRLKFLKKLQLTMKRCYSIGIANFTIRTTASSSFSLMLQIP